MFSFKASFCQDERFDRVSMRYDYQDLVLYFRRHAHASSWEGWHNNINGLKQMPTLTTLMYAIKDHKVRSWARSHLETGEKALGDLTLIYRQLFQVAEQQGQYLAKMINAREARAPSKPFIWKQLGSMATIGMAPGHIPSKLLRMLRCRNMIKWTSRNQTKHSKLRDAWPRDAHPA